MVRSWPSPSVRGRGPSDRPVRAVTGPSGRWGERAQPPEGGGAGRAAGIFYRWRGRGRSSAPARPGVAILWARNPCISVCSAISRASSTSIPRCGKGAFQLGSPSPEQELDGPQVLGPPVDERRLRAAQGVGAVVVGVQPLDRDPGLHDPGVLASREVGGCAPGASDQRRSPRPGAMAGSAPASSPACRPFSPAVAPGARVAVCRRSSGAVAGSRAWADGR